jgi:hypothetical protein
MKSQKIHMLCKEAPLGMAFLGTNFPEKNRQLCHGL